MVTKDQPKLPFEGLEYSEWSANGLKYVGMKDHSNRPHGIVRVTNRNDWVEELTCKRGQHNGLLRTITKDEVRICLEKDGVTLGMFRFDINF